MRFEIFNVEHGFCAYLQADNGNVMLFDCGHNSLTGFRPSNFFSANRVGSIQKFFVTNYDEDHISDLPSLRRQVAIETLYRNTSISPAQLRQLKLSTGGRISAAMESLLDMMGTYMWPVVSEPEFPNVTWAAFSHGYPGDFQDTNNLSMVIYLNINGTGFLITGDMEKPGWERLLWYPDFQRYLKQVHFFVASHHGRESGYCSEVFNYCSPNAVIISDAAKEFATQEMVNQYARHAKGTQFGGETRYVLTTRCDGNLWWTW